ncbi:hypothetical protein Y032_0141g2280 [Ancylostoma ceylanicum]|uniref:Uncharacterized protein n=1 Tax=Ancylostoma ceylanicum TaxID=53326 RepID=A0A016T4D2_9BILA|nr:hypothetical protein Y032_0141g2280 [Ancylostoma ceylanicum]
MRVRGLDTFSSTSNLFHESAAKLLSWSPRNKRQLKRTAEHGFTQPPRDPGARLLRGARAGILPAGG